jgi:hemoglobin
MTGSHRSGIVPVACALALVLAAAGHARAQTSGQQPEPSLYERLGGLPAIAVVVNDFMAVFTRDPVILANPRVRERKTAAAEPYVTYQVITLVCQVTGGPCEYTGASLRDAHAGLNVTASEWERMGMLFAQTLDRHAVPEQEQQELFAILGSTKDDIVVPDRR